MDRSITGMKLPPGVVSPPPELTEDEMFRKDINKTVVKRLIQLLTPYKLMVLASFLAVLIFTVSQLSIPIMVQMTLDGQITFWGEGLESLKAGVLLFAAVVVLNFISHFFMELLISRVAQRLLFDLRRSMYEHLQYVSLSFMDKTEVGRLMSRLSLIHI